MLDLEYLLLFGVPQNKWELVDGRVRWAFPFLDRDVADAHFAAWADTLKHWRGATGARAYDRATANGSPRRVFRGDGIEMSLYPGPIELQLPMDIDLFDIMYGMFWRRDLWPGQDPGKETGFEWSQRHYDVGSNLWKLFGEFCHAYGGEHCGRSVIALNDRCAVEPDHDHDDPVPPWLVPAEQRLGLEVLFFFGHPEKRYEIWNNRAPCLLAFGSAEEAELRFGHFLEEICRWEQTPLVEPSAIEPGVELAEVGRFQLTRRGRQVQLDVAVDGRKFRELLRVWGNDQAWDWGED